MNWKDLQEVQERVIYGELRGVFSEKKKSKRFKVFLQVGGSFRGLL